MKKYKKITGALSAMTCSLLSNGMAHAENNHAPGDWDISAALLFYQEPDRVSAVEPIINAKYLIDTDETFNIKLALDSLTGASANGAMPSKQAQVFTRPSGNGEYSTKAGDIPLDDTFKDTRIAASINWDKPLENQWRRNLGFGVSSEYDYLSLGINGLVSKNLNQNNTTLSVGASLQSDTIKPEGGTPEPLSIVQDGDKNNDEEKTTIDFLFGFTQVLDTLSLFQINYGFSASDGYLTDPFKLLTVIDKNTGDPIVDSVSGAAIQPLMIYENRPESRTKHSIFALYKRYFTGDVWEASYRFMRDDWGITSNTLDTRYRFQYSNNNYLQPHFRYYQQNAADFFQAYFLEDNEPNVGDKTYASADYRLGNLTAYTLGIEYGQVTKEHDWSIALEYYLQTSEDPSYKFGSLNDLTLYPDVDAYMMRITYDF